MDLLIREAETDDINQMQRIRRSVKENILLRPEQVTDEVCRAYITRRGKGWVAVSANQIIGFAIADLLENNVWALFLHPDFEDRGIGKKLHNTMLDWYFDQGKEYIWLSTEPRTRAEAFYRRQQWTETARLPNGEIRFEMDSQTWIKNRHDR